jgi:hypothetical protein
LRKEQKILNLKANVCSKHWLFVVLFLVNSIAVANFSTDNEIKVKGSNVTVAGALQLDAEHINLLAGDNQGVIIKGSE